MLCVLIQKWGLTENEIHDRRIGLLHVQEETQGREQPRVHSWLAKYSGLAPVFSLLWGVSPNTY